MTESRVLESLLRLKFPDAKKRKLFGANFKRILQLGRENGTLTVFQQQGRVRAGFCHFTTTEYFPGVKSRIIEFALDPDDRAAVHWLEGELERRARDFDRKTFIFLDRPRFILLKKLMKRGFSIESLILRGKPGPALKALMRAHQPPSNLSHLDLKIQKASPRRIDEILALYRREFSRNPQFGWFCASRPFLKRLKEDLSREVKKRGHCHYLVLDENSVVGHFAAKIGSGQRQGTAGVSFVFDRKIQGRGVVKTAYRILLEDMIEKRVEAFTGGTSQKAVLGLSKLMKRKAVAYILQFGPGAFDQAHFGKW